MLGRISRLLVFLMICSSLESLYAQAVDTENPEDLVSFQIPQLDAGTALNEFAKQAQVQMLFDYEIVHSVRTNEVHGIYPSWQALQMLVMDTGLEATRMDNSRYLVVSVNTDNEEEEAMKNARQNVFASTLAAIAASFSYNADLMAQETTVSSLEEIVVTGRKREESLQEVPVSISVLGENLISDAGIVDQYDLFEMVPGIHYDEFFDRNAALPSVRGVQSNEVATNRTKVTAFIDGMPILGSQGSISFNNMQQVEIYRGPQSAAFGRSTFGGAINYITRDPGDSFEGSIDLNINDYGTKIINGSIGGPLTDTLGYQLDAQIEDSSSLDDYIATDGIRYGERSGENYSAKLVWNPTDSFEAKLSFSHVKTEDTPTVDIYITEEARNACAGTVGVAGQSGIDSFVNAHRRSGIYNIGVTDCDWTQGPQILAQNDRALFLRNDVNGNGDLAAYAATARANGASDATSVTGSVEEDILMVAAGQSVTADNVGGFDERDRVSLQLDYLLDNGHSVQLSAMTSEEDYVRLFDESGNYTDSIAITSTPDALDPQGVVYGVNTSAAINRFMADPTSISEDYIEVRWVSPADERLRYVVGASQYQYEFETLKYLANGYGAILGGFVDEWEELTGIDQSVATSSIVETATNAGLFFNLAYDFTDKLTATLEGRYQSDDISGVDPRTGNSGGVVTKGFIPRLSLNYNLSDTTSYYVQLAKGVNPAGVNTDYFNDTAGGFVDTLDNGIPDGYGNRPDGTTDAACTGAATAANSSCNSFYVDYDSDTFDTFDEEELINIEFGFKGTALDGRFQYAGAIYHMTWKDQVNGFVLNWDHPNIATAGQTPGVTPVAAGAYNPYGVATVVASTPSTQSKTFMSSGDLTMKGAELEASYLVNNNWDVRATASYLDATYDKGFCDVDIYKTGVDTHAGLSILTQADGALSACALVGGKELKGQPKLTFSLSPNFNTDLSNGLRLNARTDLRYEGEQWLDVANVSKSPAVVTVNFSVGLSKDAWAANLYVNNLLDDDTPRQFEGGIDSSITSGLPIIGSENYKIQPRIPRSIGLRASYSF